MEKDTFCSYAWIMTTALIMAVLIMFATSYIKTVETETAEQVNQIVEISTEKEIDIYE